MGSKKEETKKKILEATVSLLDSVESPNDITIRKIAEAAGVGVGLVNYHYESRDALINEAVSMKMETLAGIMERLDGDLDDPVKYLKEMLIKMSDIGIKNYNFSKFSIEYELLRGDFRICLYLLPVLRNIFKDTKAEVELRLIAFQIIVTTQSIYLRRDAFHMLTGVDIEVKSERDKWLNTIIDNLTK